MEHFQLNTGLTTIFVCSLLLLFFSLFCWWLFVLLSFFCFFHTHLLNVSRKMCRYVWAVIVSYLCLSVYFSRWRCPNFLYVSPLSRSSAAPRKRAMYARSNAVQLYMNWKYVLYMWAQSGLGTQWITSKMSVRGHNSILRLCFLFQFFFVTALAAVWCSRVML